MIFNSSFYGIPVIIAMFDGTKVVNVSGIFAGSDDHHIFLSMDGVSVTKAIPMSRYISVTATDVTNMDDDLQKVIKFSN